MKAFQINEWGQLGQMKDIPQPLPGQDEVLVHIYAASINPVDQFAVAGYLKAMQQLPLTPGTDFAGKVVSTGAEVTHVKAGDAVYGMIPVRGGTFAEYALAKGHELALKPQSLSYEQAASVPLAALAAWQTLVEFAQVQSGERVLIHGAAGSVGSFAVQLAKARGAYVLASDLPGREAFLQDLGADVIINAQTQQFEDLAGPVDVVLNYAKAELLDASYNLLKAGGRYATTMGQPAPEEAERRGIRSFGVFTQPTVEHLTQLATLINDGKLRVFVDRVFTLDEVQTALEYKQPGTVFGKVALSMQ